LLTESEAKRGAAIRAEAITHLEESLANDPYDTQAAQYLKEAEAQKVSS